MTGTRGGRGQPAGKVRTREACGDSGRERAADQEGENARCLRGLGEGEGRRPGR